MIDAQHITLRRADRKVLEDICMTVSDHRVFGVVGPNGAGKSSFLASLYRELVPELGTVTVDGADVATLSRNAIAKRMAVVAQLPETVLPLPVRDSVALGRLTHRNVLEYGDQTDQHKVSHALRHVGLEQHAERLTTELSGGELQRVLIARAIVQEASHLLLDEPTNHLDIHHQYAVLHMVRALDTTTVIVLHDLNLAAQFCDEIALLAAGRIVATGAPFEVLTSERVSSVYGVDARVVEIEGLRHLVFRPTPEPIPPENRKKTNP